MCSDVLVISCRFGVHDDESILAPGMTRVSTAATKAWELGCCMLSVGVIGRGRVVFASVGIRQVLVFARYRRVDESLEVLHRQLALYKCTVIRFRSKERMKYLSPERIQIICRTDRTPVLHL